MESFPSPAATNRLLASLPPVELQRIASDLAYRPLKFKQRIHTHGSELSEVLFPGRCVCAITNTMEDGAHVEVATTGSEGLVGVGAILGGHLASGDAFIQVQGQGGYAMPIGAFRREMDRRGAFYDVVTKYGQAFVGLLMQSVACNGLHSAEERCCRWLLIIHDRIQSDEFAMTHEVMAVMLGVRRPTVTLVMAQLTAAGMVAHVRGRIRIIDRTALEGASCECYRTVRSLFDRLLPEAVVHNSAAS